MRRVIFTVLLVLGLAVPAMAQGYFGVTLAVPGAAVSVGNAYPVRPYWHRHHHPHPGYNAGYNQGWVDGARAATPPPPPPYAYHYGPPRW